MMIVDSVLMLAYRCLTVEEDDLGTTKRLINKNSDFQEDVNVDGALVPVSAN
jgi:hypothetical protein